jgi:hypothetical protein
MVRVSVHTAPCTGSHSTQQRLCCFALCPASRAARVALVAVASVVAAVVPSVLEMVVTKLSKPRGKSCPTFPLSFLLANCFPALLVSCCSAACIFSHIFSVFGVRCSVFVVCCLPWLASTDNGWLASTDNGWLASAGNSWLTSAGNKFSSKWSPLSSMRTLSGRSQTW